MSKFQLTINPESPALLPLLLGSVLKESKGITVLSRRDAAVSKGTAVLRSLAKGGVEVTGTETDISIALLGALPEFMGGTDILKRADILYWVNLSKQRPPMALMGLLNERLKMRSFIVGHSLTLADLACIVPLCGQDWSTDVSSSKKFANCGRWARNVLSILDFAAVITNMMPKVKSEPQNRDATKKEGDKPKDERAEMNLPNAVMGEVVTRFPPEPSGYLHIGHAKAALLNNYFAQRYKGKLLIRFDDTNPSKEKEEFRESILEDLNLLNVHGDALSYTSDHFGRLIEVMDGLIAKGICYVDDTPVEQMRLERGEGVDSKARLHSIEENQRRWAEMKSGSEEGLKNCVRAKLNMQDKNKCMRDPVMYRCNAETPHHRTGHTFLVYPTYDFACPLVDSWEGVTHAMRTNEYADRIPQYFWVQTVCGVRKCEIYEFSRLNFVNTVLSKRKLQWFVDQGLVTGWDDPRFPTVRGVRRKGLQVEAMMEFLLQQGPSKNVNLMEWDKLWALNKQLLDPIVPRYMAVDGKHHVTLTMAGAPKAAAIERELHPKNPSVGKVPQILTGQVLLELEDAEKIECGEEVTLMRWGNAIVDKVLKEDDVVVGLEGRLHLEGDVKKTKKKLHWLPLTNAATVEGHDAKLTTIVVRELDHLITKKKLEESDDFESVVNHHTIYDTECLADPAVKQLKEGDCIQLERRGYFRVDVPHSAGAAMVMIAIPDGRTKSMSGLSTKVDLKTQAKGR